MGSSAPTPNPRSKKRASGRECPVCGKPSTPESAPFCSPRCADVDLHRWLSGTYVIPGRPLGSEDEEGLPGEADDVPSGEAGQPKKRPL